LSVFANDTNEWVYRLFDRRTITVKAKNEEVRKIAAIDVMTRTPFGIEIPENVPIVKVEIEKSYYASLKVYTARKTEGIAADYVNFFKILDVDQSIEDFLKAYWQYPKLIKFELTEIEPI
jgi:hypothetical protein